MNQPFRQQSKNPIRELNSQLLPGSRREWESRVRGTILELRSNHEPCHSECFRSNDVHPRMASIQGVINEAARQGGVPARWIEQVHWEPDEDDPGRVQDGVQYRFLLANPRRTGSGPRPDDGETPSETAAPESLLWHGMRITPHGDHLTPANLLDPSITRPMKAHQCESLDQLPICLVNDMLYETRYHPHTPPVNPLAHFASIMERLLKQPEHGFWDPALENLREH